MSDEIHIRDLLVRAIIGVNDEERVNRQDVIINVTLETDTRKAGRTDELADAVNYREVAKKVVELTERSRFYLVERLAEEIARVCLEDKRVQRVRVSVEKPGAIRFARSVGVTIVRQQQDVQD